jgi:hypothetical protein
MINNQYGRKNSMDYIINRTAKSYSPEEILLYKTLDPIVLYATHILYSFVNLCKFQLAAIVGLVTTMRQFSCLKK